MGRYVNPGNIAFSRIAGSNYVDKTGLVSLMNEKIGGETTALYASADRAALENFMLRKCLQPITINPAILISCLMKELLQRQRNMSNISCR